MEKPNGKLRICLDPKDLNTAIKQPHYPLPTLEDALSKMTCQRCPVKDVLSKMPCQRCPVKDVLSKMTGAKFFSKLDARSGYWQLKPSPECSYLTTFNTPYGRYRFLPLPFGIISAQDEFQRKMDETFEGLPGVTPLVDDIIVTGRTREETTPTSVNARESSDQESKAQP